MAIVLRAYGQMVVEAVGFLAGLSSVQQAWRIASVVLALFAITLVVNCLLAGVRWCWIGVRRGLCAILGYCTRVGTAAAGAPTSVVELAVGLYTWPWVAVARYWDVKECEHKYAPLLPVCEDKAVVRKEMANPNCPSKPAAWPKFLVSLLNSEGAHVGFGSYLNTAYGMHLVTAVHVMNASRVGDGIIRVSNGHGKMYELTDANSRIVRGSRDFDQVHIEGPAALGALLGLRASKPGLFDQSKPVTVFSPTATGIESATSMAVSPYAGKLSYAASTIPGSSGSPLIQGERVVGVHVEGRLQKGVVRNSGYGILGYLTPSVIRETSSKAAHLAWLHEHVEDFEAEEGWRMIDDFLDYKPEMRRMGMFYAGKGRLVTTSASKPVVKEPFKPVSGIYWADLVDEEEMEQGNGMPGRKTSSQASPSQAPSSQEKSEPASSTTGGSKPRRSRNRRAASRKQDASPPSGQTQKPAPSASSSTQQHLSQPSGSGQPQTDRPAPKGAASSTRPIRESKPSSLPPVSESGSSRKSQLGTPAQSAAYLRQQAARLHALEAKNRTGAA